jgi:hypothetical protein
MKRFILFILILLTVLFLHGNQLKVSDYKFQLYSQLDEQFGEDKGFFSTGIDTLEYRNMYYKLTAGNQPWSWNTKYNFIYVYKDHFYKQTISEDTFFIPIHSKLYESNNTQLRYRAFKSADNQDTISYNSEGEYYDTFFFFSYYDSIILVIELSCGRRGDSVIVYPQELMLK